MFGWFKKAKGVTREEDKLWMDQSAKAWGICQELRARQAQGDLCLLLLHFEESFGQMEETLRRAGLAYAGYRTASEVGRLRLGTSALGGPVQLILSEVLPTTPPVEPGAALEGRISLLVGERYPIPAREEQVERFAAALPQPTRLCFHGSLDEALLQRFMDSNMTDLMRKLGVNETECVSSSLLSKSIKSAQQRIAKQSSSDLRSRSAVHWFENNMPFTQ